VGFILRITKIDDPIDVLSVLFGIVAICGAIQGKHAPGVKERQDPPNRAIAKHMRNARVIDPDNLR
jgi:hypothetical protein